MFRLDTSGGNYTVLHTFSDGTVVNDGWSPWAGLTRDSAGNLYGTTVEAGLRAKAWYSGSTLRHDTLCFTCSATVRMPTTGMTLLPG